MIFGDCPYCGHMGAFNVPEDVQLPVMIKATCDACGMWFWEHVSRVNPMAYRQDQVIVDEESMTVQVVETPMSDDAKLARDVLQKMVYESQDEMIERLLYGDKGRPELPLSKEINDLFPDPPNLNDMTEKRTEWVQKVLEQTKLDPFNVRKATINEDIPEAGRSGRPAVAGGEGTVE